MGCTTPWWQGGEEAVALEMYLLPQTAQQAALLFSYDWPVQLKRSPGSLGLSSSFSDCLIVKDQG